MFKGRGVTREICVIDVPVDARLFMFDDTIPATLYSLVAEDDPGTSRNCRQDGSAVGIPFERVNDLSQDELDSCHAAVIEACTLTGIP